MARQVTRADILDPAAFEAVRRERRAALLETKKQRRVAVGPHATYYFESYDTMWWQIHEMLRIERGGEAQIPDELEAYNTLIPQGRELVATIMFEIDDPVRRKTVLSGLGGVEETCFLAFGTEEITGTPEADVDRTTADGKASSVQFVHFPFTDAQVAAFRQPGTRVTLGMKHPRYAHMTVLPEEAREALARDFE